MKSLWNFPTLSNRKQVCIHYCAHGERVCWRWLVFAPVTWRKASHRDTRFGADDGDDDKVGDNMVLQCRDEERWSHSGWKLTPSCRAQEQWRGWNIGTIPLKKTQSKNRQKIYKYILINEEVEVFFKQHTIIFNELTGMKRQHIFLSMQNEWQETYFWNNYIQTKLN